MAVVKHQQPRNIEGAMLLCCGWCSVGVFFCSSCVPFQSQTTGNHRVHTLLHSYRSLLPYSIYELLPPLPVLLVCAPTVGAASQRQNTRKRERERERKKRASEQVNGLWNIRKKKKKKKTNKKIDSGNGNCCGETVAGRGYIHFSLLHSSFFFSFFSI